MSNKELADLYLYYTGENYNKIEKLLNQPFMKNEFNKDILHDTILRVYDIISKKGFKFITGNINLSGESFLNYIFQSYSMNNLKNLQDSKKKKDKEISIDKTEEFNEERVRELIHADATYEKWRNRETSLGLIQDDEEERLEIMIAEDIIIDEIYKWVENNYHPIQCGFFKFYYMNKITYEVIAEFTNYSESYIFGKVQEVKKGVLKEFANIKFPNRKRKVKKVKV